MEIIGDSIKGIYRDILKGNDGDIAFDSGWVSNTIVDRCRMLLAGFVKNDSSDAAGIQFLAVGQGLEVWDDTGAPFPAPATIDLENGYEPHIPAEDLDMVYLDGDDSVVAGPTNRLQITATLGPGYPTPLPAPLSTYPLREFGLFGSLDDTDYMINYIRHPVIHKDESATLIRVVRLYF